MINERVKKRLKKDRPSTTITMRIPADVVESLKAVAPMRGFTAYQTLLKSYISEGLRREARPQESWLAYGGMMRRRRADVTPDGMIFRGRHSGRRSDVPLHSRERRSAGASHPQTPRCRAVRDQLRWPEAESNELE